MIFRDDAARSGEVKEGQRRPDVAARGRILRSTRVRRVQERTTPALAKRWHRFIPRGVSPRHALTLPNRHNDDIVAPAAWAH